MCNTGNIAKSLKQLQILCVCLHSINSFQLTNMHQCVTLSHAHQAKANNGYNLWFFECYPRSS